MIALRSYYRFLLRRVAVTRLYCPSEGSNTLSCWGCCFPPVSLLILGKGYQIYFASLPSFFLSFQGIKMPDAIKLKMHLLKDWMCDITLFSIATNVSGVWPSSVAFKVHTLFLYFLFSKSRPSKHSAINWKLFLLTDVQNNSTFICTQHNLYLS